MNRKELPELLQYHRELATAEWPGENIEVQQTHKGLAKGFERLATATPKQREDLLLELADYIRCVYDKWGTDCDLDDLFAAEVAIKNERRIAAVRKELGIKQLKLPWR